MEASRDPDMPVSVCPVCAVLRNDRDELLHCAVRCVPSPRRAGSAGVESSSGLPVGAPQVHEHGWTDDTGGSQVGLKNHLKGAVCVCGGGGVSVKGGRRCRYQTTDTS